jgi:hypothetical protein
VIPQREWRPRSPSGVMLASIDSPHGDQAERIAPATAATQPSTTSSVTGRFAPIASSPGGAPGSRPEPGYRLGSPGAIPAAASLASIRSARAAAAALAGVRDRVGEQRLERGPGGRHSLAAHAAVDEHEVGAPGTP